VDSARYKTDFDPADEQITTAESLWIDLEPHVRQRALRILSDLCYAYITTAEVDSTLDNNDSEFDPASKGESQAT
jgi:hypothetical protein